MLRQMYVDPQPTDPAMGGDCTGTVVAVGEGVTRFTVGDAVFGAAKGAFAEYAIAAEQNLVHKPDNVSFVDAAAIPTGGLTALQGLRDQGHIASDQRILIIIRSRAVQTANNPESDYAMQATDHREFTDRLATNLQADAVAAISGCATAANFRT